MRWLFNSNFLTRNSALFYSFSIGFFVIKIVLFIIGVALLIYFLTKNKNILSSQDKTPLDILKERYAKGEISEEEYNKMRENLNKENTDSFK